VSLQSQAQFADILSALPIGPAGRALEYLEAIDKRGGKARRMDFLRIAGSEAAVDRWVSFLVRHGMVVEAEEDGSRIYAKTDFGERIHKTLNDHRTVKIIIEHLSGRRLRP
jgi:hypothetical protein